MNSQNQDPATRAREVRRQLSQGATQELGALTLRLQQTGHAEADRRAQNLLDLRVNVAAALARLDAEGTYEGSEMVDLTGVRSYRRDDLLRSSTEEAGWQILDYSHTAGAATMRDRYYLLADGSYAKVSTRSIGDQEASRSVRIVSAGNVSTLTQPQFDTLLQNVGKLGAGETPAQPSAE